jgi:hypothetical protein
MDGVGEDFSGLPRRGPVDREFRRGDRNRGRIARIAVVGGFVIVLMVVAISLIVLYAPTPYLGMSHGALANSVDGSSARGCSPSGDGWNCWKDGSAYHVRADWAGCWTGEPVGKSPSVDTREKIYGCVSIMDHLTAG